LIRVWDFLELVGKRSAATFCLSRSISLKRHFWVLFIGGVERGRKCGRGALVAGRNGQDRKEVLGKTSGKGDHTVSNDWGG